MFINQSSLITNQFPSIIEVVEHANQDLLLDILRNAEISVGHFLDGRLIRVPGYSGHIHLSQLESRVNTLYEAALKPVRQPKRTWATERKDTRLFFMRPRHGRTSNFLKDVFLGRYRGEVSPAEASGISLTLKWRSEIDAEFYRLIAKGNKKVEESNFSLGLVIKLKNFIINEEPYVSPRKNDEIELDNLVKSRRRRVIAENLFKTVIVACFMVRMSTIIDDYQKGASLKSYGM